MSSDPLTDPRVGTRFGPNELRAPAGRGGIGEVHQAYDATEDRTVALELLAPRSAQDAKYPKWFDNVPITNRADVHSLACVLHEVPSGRCAA